MAVVKLGPGTITVGAVPLDFSAEVKAVTITHGYDETSEAVTYLDGSSTPAAATRNDGVTFEADNSLAAEGIYAYCQTNDMTEQPFDFVPNTSDGAAWSGTVQVRLPEEIGSDAYGNPLASSCEWLAVGALDFTPTPVPPA